MRLDSRAPLAKLLFDGLMYSKQQKKDKVGEKRELLLYANYKRPPTPSVCTCAAVSSTNPDKKNMPLKCQNNYSVERKNAAAETIRGIGESAASLGSCCRLAAAACLQVAVAVTDKEEKQSDACPRPPRSRLSHSRSGSNEAPQRYQAISRNDLRARL